MEERETDRQNRRMRRHYECQSFLTREAGLLDDRELAAWLDLLTEDVTYDMPVRVTREAGSNRSEFSDEAFNYREDRSTLEARVERFQTEYAWSEDPPSRTRRFVSNVRVGDADGDETPVESYLLVTRSQGDTPETTTLSAQRHDVLRRVEGDLRLAERVIHLDSTVLPMKNLSIFL